ncbi:MAG TPA: type II secretion system F family protein [Chthoniobacteraceae bacterium]|nr:type II secretion system F family protein [Chthoniobacteraceae bacterium]
MPAYSYEAVERGGGRKQGEIEARSRAEACDKLERARLQPLWLRLKSAKETAPAAEKMPEAASALPKGGFRLSAKEVMLFTEELSDLLEAGLQLEQALRIMENRQDASMLKAVSTYLRNEVREGVDLSAAMRKASPSFGELFCNLVAAGEQSGALHAILKRTLDYQRLVAELKSKVVAALVYPSFIAMAGLILIVLFVSYLVPQLGSLLGTTGKKMPLATVVLINSSQFMAAYWWLLGLIAIAVAVGFRTFIHTPSGRAWWDRAQLQVPLVGAVLRAKFLAQLAQTLATLTGNGIALYAALKLTNAATPNVYLQTILSRVTDDVGEGTSLSRAVARTRAFPSVFIDMIVVGEQTGDLPMALEKAGARYDKELNAAIATLTSMIQPAVIVVVAGIVGVVAYSMMGGIFQAVSGLRSP